ncbi:DUF5131 family protein [Ferviditalea candida]|uniref:DUF5131 family protein n=1 Tax=Ferviditalea candida TaxID=3108399 RepID=A0ABU5ZKN6_9BACL|nr:DUF5131 family protein [Paenibacillaceae bacterium T2]
MSDKTKIEWADATWNPITGCTKVSEGCRNCYAMILAERFRGTPGHYYENGFDITLRPDKLDQPLKWKRPRRIFVNSMSDLFHEQVPFDFIDQVFAIMALASHHTFMVLTKRPERMLEYCSNPQTPFRVARQVDVISAIKCLGDEEIRPISGYPGYFASSHGYIYSEKRGRRKRMKPDIGEQGHQRVQLHREGAGRYGDRLLVHRIILEMFVGTPPTPDAQGRHRDGNPGNNAVSNLLWGDQGENWSDSKRHGSYRRYSKLTHQQVTEIRLRHDTGESNEALAREFDVSATQIRNITSGAQWSVETPIEWPLRNCWKGISVENQKAADERIPLLLQTPAAVRFLSCEPLLGPVDLERHLNGGKTLDEWKARALSGVDPYGFRPPYPRIHWDIVGGESGPRARPMHPEWVRSIRDQCQAAGVPFFFKQWGEWSPWYGDEDDDCPCGKEHEGNEHCSKMHFWGYTGSGGPAGYEPRGIVCSYRVGKKSAGRLLGGREWNDFPGS